MENNATLQRSIKVDSLPPCTMHPARQSIARMTYLLAGNTRKSHYNVCIDCLREFDHGATLLSVALFALR